MVVNLRRSCFKGDEVIAFFLLRIQEERLIWPIWNYRFWWRLSHSCAHTWTIFLLKWCSHSEDFELLTETRNSQPIPKVSMWLLRKHFIEEEQSSNLLHNASTGPIYIGKRYRNYGISVIHWPFALCNLEG
jgi:hypothetical protein